jgi:hypothetical protein
MRATEGNYRMSTWRKLVGMAAAATIALSFAGTVTAADSRILYVGSLVDGTNAIIDADHNGIPDNDKKLIPTSVNAGYSTAVPIQVLNGDNQNIAHVVLTFPATGTLADSGLTVSDVGGTDKLACAKVLDANLNVIGVRCAFDNLAAGAMRSIFIVVATTVATTKTDLFTVNVTTNNENGSNLQSFIAASGAFNVQAATPNGLSAFVAPGQLAKTFNTNAIGGTNKLQTKLDFTQSSGGNLVSIAETEGGTTFQYRCPVELGLVCQPAETSISVQNGLTGTSATFGSAPYLSVTLTALVPKTFNLNKAFVAHYGASTTTPDWILSWATKTDRCGTNITAKLATVDQCFNTATLSKPNADGLETLVLQVITKHNGGMRY